MELFNVERTYAWLQHRFGERFQRYYGYSQRSTIASLIYGGYRFIDLYDRTKPNFEKIA